MSHAEPDTVPETGSSVLLNAVISLLAPMFLWSTGGDVAYARLAAMETLVAYRATGPRSLITATKIIAFELAALWSLSQSMSDEISLSMALRLRGNANSMDRAADRNRQTLEQDCRIAESSDLPDEAELQEAVAEAQKMVQQANARIRAGQQPPVAAPAASVPAAPAPAPLAQARAAMPEEQRRAAWAGAMAAVAGEMTADMANLPPKQRAEEMLRVEALTQTAAALVSGAPLPPFPPGR
jgi:hypothetical protein